MILEFFKTKTEADEAAKKEVNHQINELKTAIEGLSKHLLQKPAGVPNPTLSLFKEERYPDQVPPPPEKNSLEKKLLHLEPISPHGSSSSLNDFEPVKELKRRQTMFEQPTFPLNTDNRVNRATITYSLPPYTEIKLNYLTPKAAIRFCNQVREYEIEHGVELPLVNLISNECRLELMNCLGRVISPADFFVKPKKEIWALIHEKVKPTSKGRFIKVLSECINRVVFPKDYQVRESNFNYCHKLYLIYREDFVSKLSFLSEDNIDNVPECTDRHDGLVGIFLDGMNTKKEDIPSIVYSQFTYDERQAFIDRNPLVMFEKFLKILFKKFQKMLEMHQTAVELGETMRPLVIKRPEGRQEERSFQRSDSKKTPQRTFKITDSKQKNITQRRLYNIDNDFENDFLHFDEEDEFEFSQSLQAVEDGYEQPDDENPEEQVPSDEEEVDGDEMDLHALNYTPDPNKPNACFSLLFYKKCVKGKDKCKYDHSPEVMRQGHRYYMRLLDSSEYKDRGPMRDESAPKRILENKDKKLTSSKPSPKLFRKDGPKLHAIEEEPVKE
jgi:hypothetical protein